MKDNKGAYIFKNKNSNEIVLFTYEKMPHNRIGSSIPKENHNKHFKQNHTHLITMYECDHETIDDYNKISDYLGSANISDVSKTISHNNAIDLSLGYQAVNAKFPLSKIKFDTFIKLAGRKGIQPQPSK
jgi:type I site-specific restriction endonuclease